MKIVSAQVAEMNMRQAMNKIKVELTEDQIRLADKALKQYYDSIEYDNSDESPYIQRLGAKFRKALAQAKTK